MSIKNITALIESYQSKTFQQLRSIQPQWAYAERIGNLIDKRLHPDHNEYTIFLANTEQLFKNSVFGEVGKDNLFTGDDKNDTRIAMLLYRWESGLPVDPPTIGFRGKPDNSIVFADGRHRTKLTYFLGHTELPVAVDNDCIDPIRRIIDLTPL